jgi:hypothetical protein
MTQVEVQTGSREMLSEMMGEEPILPPEFSFLVFSLANFVSKIERQVKELPPEILSFFRVLMSSLASQDDRLTDSVEEETAAKTLLEYFGKPRSSEAVPVFVQLVERTLESKEIVKLLAQSMHQVWEKCVDFIIYVVILSAEEELKKLYEDRAKQQAAVTQLAAVEAGQEISLKQRVDLASNGFRLILLELKSKIEILEEKITSWRTLADGLIGGSFDLINLSRQPIEIGPLDSAKAL